MSPDIAKCTIEDILALVDSLCLRASAMVTKRRLCVWGFAGQGHLWDLGPDRHHSGFSQGSKHKNVSWCLNAQKCGATTTTMPGSPWALIHFRNHINLFTKEEVQFLGKYHLSLDAPILILFLIRGPRVICLLKWYLKTVHFSQDL